MGAVDRRIVHVQQACCPQLREEHLVEAGPDAGLGPVPQPSRAGHPGAPHDLGRDVAPGHPFAQHVDDAGQRDAGRYRQSPGVAMAPGRSAVHATDPTRSPGTRPTRPAATASTCANVASRRSSRRRGTTPPTGRTGLQGRPTRQPRCRALQGTEHRHPAHRMITAIRALVRDAGTSESVQVAAVEQHDAAGDATGP